MNNKQIRIRKALSAVQKQLVEEEKKYFYFHRRRYTELLAELCIKPGTRILDVGCSNGHMLLAAKILGAETYGLDYITKWKSRFDENGTIFKTCNIEKERFPYKSNFFDYVIMGEVIEHLVETVDLPIEESKRVLKKGGKLILSTPNACELGKRLLFLFGENIYWDLSTYYERGIYERHNREFNMKEVLGLVKKSGLHAQKTVYLSSWEGLRGIEKTNPLAKLVSVFQRMIPQFRSNMLVIAKK
jgi:2-polyprenyl-3-methyl-5-hydroxy-6-metoxy-1,4-benzoquinol methylase